MNFNQSGREGGGSGDRPGVDGFVAVHVLDVLVQHRAQGVVPAHAHHAVQIVIALDGHIAIRDRHHDWRESRGIIVRADASGQAGVTVKQK